uniref:Uncharacterized protein n=1 Tax=Glossina pallidipes TaxID=7398 RepID=A0A1A9ZI67_GLOPL
MSQQPGFPVNTSMWKEKDYDRWQIFLFFALGNVLTDVNGSPQTLYICLIYTFESYKKKTFVITLIIEGSNNLEKILISCITNSAKIYGCHPTQYKPRLVHCYEEISSDYPLQKPKKKKLWDCDVKKQKAEESTSLRPLTISFNKIDKIEACGIHEENVLTNLHVIDLLLLTSSRFYF